jgi:PBP1b-binding outer membrane lipoprotein LpoB
MKNLFVLLILAMFLKWCSYNKQEIVRKQKSDTVQLKNQMIINGSFMPDKSEDDLNRF